VQSLRRRWTAVLIFAAAIAAAAFDLVPIAISALGGVLAMAVTHCIDLNATYKRVEWKVYFLIAGLIPMGIAIENTGLDDQMAKAFIQASHGFSPFAVVVTLYATTVLITNIMANNATALLMAPIAVKIALQLGMDPKALLLTIMFGASTSFFTPVGYHTLTLVYTPGHYRFTDYFTAGLPLTLIVGTIACVMIALQYGVL
jgi:di/tricarboxylate transporter